MKSAPKVPTKQPGREKRLWLLAPGELPFFAAILLIALNLRPALASLSTVLPEIMLDLSIRPTTASILTMTPVFLLGLSGFITPRFSAVIGRERMILLSLVVLTSGNALRGVPSFYTLFIGTMLAGIGIGVAGVLIPALIKQHFQRNIGQTTGWYTMFLCLGASLGVGATVPLTVWLGGWWKGLAFWSVPCAAALIAWSYQTPKNGYLTPLRKRGRINIWRNRIAWQVTLFMGLQSSLSYIVLGWLAPLLRDRGLDAATAGWVVSLSALLQAPAALGVPILLGRSRSQSAIIVASMTLTLIGLLGALYAPLSTIWWWTSILGMAQGSNFSIALSLIVFRAKDAHSATNLSGMAQSVGYSVAALGPLSAGLLKDLTGSWTLLGVVLSTICLLAACIGYCAGKDRIV